MMEQTKTGKWQYREVAGNTRIKYAEVKSVEKEMKGTKYMGWFVVNEM